MKLFTKSIEKQLQAQFPLGAEFKNQKVIAKIFNPYGQGTWYLMNQDPDKPDYIWAIVKNFAVEAGSVLKSELVGFKAPPFNLGLERDKFFDPMPAKEVWDKLNQGIHV